MALNVQGVSPRDLFLEAPQEPLQPEMQLPQALAPQPSKCVCTRCHKNLPITSVTPGSPTGPACISAPDPTPDPGLDTNFVMTTSLLEVQLQGVTNAITSSVMGPLRSLERQHHTSPPLPSASMLPTNTLPAPNNPGESSVRRLFPWIPTETINAVYKDLLWPSNLSKLHNMTAAMPSGEKVTLSLGTYKLALTLPAPMPSTKTFLKAIPNLVSFCQAWIVYTALCAVASPDCMLGPTLAGFLVHVAELDQHFDWTYIANYILTVCEKRFGHADMDTWSRHNREAFQDKLSIAPTKTPKTTAAPTEPKRVGTNNMVCLCWNNSTCTSNCGWSHTCLVCGTKNHPSHSCQNLTKFKPSQPSSVAAETASQPNIKARGTA
ncbi:uncharacterized protein UHOR_16029 [Ustilago hordei]|uniref:Uncharacterized protein n=1 Tax=Ustilago hordei TaxID=120017 RepID=I2G2Z2_USTHO|nr:uncharacterized protein UHOR_16029 [Ustilago hordei]